MITSEEYYIVPTVLLLIGMLEEGGAITTSKPVGKKTRCKSKMPREIIIWKVQI